LGIQLLDSRCNGTIEHKAFENFKLYKKNYFVEFLDTIPFCGRIALPRKSTFFKVVACLGQRRKKYEKIDI
jgi:hypothetical protein